MQPESTHRILGDNKLYIFFCATAQKCFGRECHNKWCVNISIQYIPPYCGVASLTADDECVRRDLHMQRNGRHSTHHLYPSGRCASAVICMARNFAFFACVCKEGIERDFNYFWSNSNFPHWINSKTKRWQNCITKIYLRLCRNWTTGLRSFFPSIQFQKFAFAEWQSDFNQQLRMTPSFLNLICCSHFVCVCRIDLNVYELASQLLSAIWHWLCFRKYSDSSTTTGTIVGGGGWLLVSNRRTKTLLAMFFLFSLAQI